MKKYAIKLFVLFSLVLFITGCNNSNKIKDEVSYITINSFTADTKGVELNFYFDNQTDTYGYEFVMYIDDGKNSLKSSLKAGLENLFTMKIETPESTQLNGDMKIELILKNNEGKELEKVIMKTKNFCIQLNQYTAKCIVSQMTDEEKCKLVTGYSLLPEDKNYVAGAAGYTYPIERFGVNSIVMADGPAGVRINTQSISYPSGTNLAQTWDNDLVRNAGVALGEDCRKLNINVLLAPGMNIHRNVLNGRNFEYYSEDPFLTGKIAAAYTDGLQSKGVAVAIKHFAVNNQESCRGSVSSEITERALREIYLTGFEIAIKDSNPWTIMSSYNRINGIYTSVNKDLLSGILRDEWGFNGLVMSDWGSSGNADDKIKASNDLNMPGEEQHYKTVLSALKSGKILKEELDFCCENILNLISKVKPNDGTDKLDSKKNAKLSRKYAADSMVLLKNEDTLPIKNCNIALFGNGQKYTVTTGFGAGDVNTEYQVNIMKGLEESKHFELNIDLLNYYLVCKQDPIGIDKDENPLNDTTEVVLDDSIINKAAKDSDVAIFVISRTTREGVDHSSSKGDYKLNDREFNMIKKVSESFHNEGKKLIVLINSGNPIETESWTVYSDAIIYVGIAGMETGNAVADILSGDVSPSGKLTSTWPCEYVLSPSARYFPGNSDKVIYFEDIYVGYRFYETFDVKTSYEFGYGLSYTDFKYESYNMSQKNGEIKVNVTVKNTGKRSGREIVQLYITKPGTIQEQAKYELVAYGKTKLLKPGEKQRLTLVVSESMLRTYVTDRYSWIIEQGKYMLSLGSSVKQIIDTFEFEQEKEKVLLETTNLCVPKNNFEILTKAKGLPEDLTNNNIALDKKATCNVNEGKHYAEYVVDGSYTSRWSGFAPSSNKENWIMVDLQDSYRVGTIIINWEACNVKYKVEISEDGKTFNEIFARDNNAELYDKIVLDKSTRYIRISGDKANWFSIYEIEVYEKK